MNGGERKKKRSEECGKAEGGAGCGSGARRTGTTSKNSLGAIAAARTRLWARLGEDARRRSRHKDHRVG